MRFQKGYIGQVETGGMHRRRFLATLGLATGFAGCSGTPEPGGSDTPTLSPVDPPGTASPMSTGTLEGGNGDEEDDSLGRLGASSVVELGTVARTYALAPTRYRSHDDAAVGLEFVETATVDHPARVRATLTNAARWSNTFRLDETAPFGPHVRTGGIRQPDADQTYRSNLVFAPTERNEVADHVPAVERAADGTWRLAGPIDRPWNPDTVRLAAEESVLGDWYLVGRSEGTEAGRPPGRYEFRSGDTDLTVTVWDTERPGPDGGSQFDGREVPALPHSTDPGWYHEAGPETAAYLEPSVEQTTLPGGVDLTLYNHTHGQLSGGGWNLYKLQDGVWFYLEPWVHAAALRILGVGGRRRYRLHAFSGPPLRAGDAISVGHLGGGTYGFESSFGHDCGPGSFAALLELDGPPVAVTPSEGAAAERDGATVRVEWSRRPEVPRATLTVERTDSKRLEWYSRLLLEQVMRRRNRGLRNTLTFFEQRVERVVLRTDRNTVSAAAEASGYEPASRQFLFDGDTFEATATFDGG